MEVRDTFHHGKQVYPLRAKSKAQRSIYEAKRGRKGGHLTVIEVGVVEHVAPRFDEQSAQRPLVRWRVANQPVDILKNVATRWLRLESPVFAAEEAIAGVH
jgi:hypothetical protein